jgi:hypothetical protein
MWNENKNDKWSSSPYGLRAGSMYGTGSSRHRFRSGIALNDDGRLIWANAWNNGVPREFVNDQVITELSADPQIPTRIQTMKSQPSVIGYGYFTAPASAAFCRDIRSPRP